MLRELTIEEMDGVSGGDGVIVVNGIRPSSGFAPSPGDGAGGIGSGLSGFQNMDLSGLAALGSFDFANWDPTGAFQAWVNDPDREAFDFDGDGLDDYNGAIIVNAEPQISINLGVGAYGGVIGVQYYLNDSALGLYAGLGRPGFDFGSGYQYGHEEGVEVNTTNVVVHVSPTQLQDAATTISNGGPYQQLTSEFANLIKYGQYELNTESR